MMKQPSAVLITGGAGFIGSHLAELLLRQGCRVVLLDNFNAFYDPAAKRRNVAVIQRTAAATGAPLAVVKGDIRSAADVERALLALGPGGDQAVIHLAAMAGVRPSIDDPLLYHEVNIGGTLQLLEGCRAFGLKRLIFASSSSVYGNNPQIPFTESDAVDHPISPYAATKKAGELLCHNYHHLYGFSVACLRFFTVYGPRQRPDLAIHKFARLLADNRPLPFFGDGSTRRDYTYITDTLQGIVGALGWLGQSENPRYEIFNLGEARTVSLEELLRLLEQALGCTAKLERLPLQPGDVACTYADIGKARKFLAYAPEVPIEVGIRLFVEWFRENASAEKSS